MGFEFDGMRLHEYYFENLGGKGDLSQSAKLRDKLAASFGSYEAWEAVDHFHECSPSGLLSY